MSQTQSTMAASCPACGGEMKFDPTSGKLKCEFCGSTYTPEEAEAAWKEKEEKVASQGASPQTDSGEMKSYSCSTCGAELMADQNTAVMRCPYCGNQTIAAAQFSGEFRPNRIIPFGFTKEQAVEKYHSYYQKRLLLPKSFMTDSHVEEIQGVYVPFWLFSGQIHIEGSYEAEDSKSIDDNYKKVKIYEVQRQGDLGYENVPADASKRMEDDLMDSIEPYKMEDMKDFAMSYLPGFLAERFDVKEEENEKRAKERVQNTTSEMAKKTIRHEKVKTKHENFSYSEEKTDYALFPAWLLVTKYKDKDYKFAMNGQTGKMIGDLPISIPKFLAVIIPVFAAVLILSYLIFSSVGTAIIIAAVVTLIVGAVMYTSMKPVARASGAAEYVSKPLNLTLQEEQFIREERRRK